MEQQHPIPQQITSYEFKLVGEMTLKQFGKAAGGVILALIINASGLVFFIKWPLMFVFGGGGLALAFVPFQDRPLETWLIAFLKSIYSPTMYLWKKIPNQDWLELSSVKQMAATESEDVDEFDFSVETKKKRYSRVEEFILSLKNKGQYERLAPDDTQEEDKVAVEEKTEAKIKKVEVKEEIKPKEVEIEKAEEVTESSSARVDLNLKKEKLGATGQAVFGSIPMPDTPDVPNVLVGMVTDQQEKIVEGAIVEILDKESNPVRVLKTNALGQFKTSTQLANGSYLVIPEKAGLKFDRVEVSLTGKIMEPIKIKAIG